MHAEMNRNEDEVDSEDVDLTRPPTDSRVTCTHYLWVEERVEGVNFEPCAPFVCALATPVHQQIHVEVDDL